MAANRKFYSITATQTESEVTLKFDNRESFRICLLNRTHEDPQIAIAVPSHGDFNVGYRWLISFEFRYVGIKKLTKILSGRRIAFAVRDEIFIAGVLDAMQILKEQNREYLRPVRKS